MCFAGVNHHRKVFTGSLPHLHQLHRVVNMHVVIADPSHDRPESEFALCKSHQLFHVTAAQTGIQSTDRGHPGNKAIEPGHTKTRELASILVGECPIYLYPMIIQAVSLIRIRFTRLKPAALVLAIASCQIS